MSGVKLDANRILVPVNGDKVSERIFRWACQLARQSKAHIHAVYVIEVPLDMRLVSEIAEASDRGEEILARMEAIAAEEKVKDVHAMALRARHAGPAIVIEAEDRKMDAVMLGVPYRRRFGSCTLGSTASYIFNNAPCQVIFWRERAPSRYLRKASPCGY